MKSHDKEAPSKYITYLEANDLYGWAMSQCLPTGGFKWMTEKQIHKLILAKCTIDSTKGLILELDLQSWTKRVENIKNWGYFAHYVLNIAHY